ncbi:MAG: hypothetical protein JW969_07060 [Spirochaetales bacterium]|nr:hypothetical protein [Spirochaetales bacterium]
MSKLIYPELSNKVLGIANTVHRNLGTGLLEAAYEGAVCEYEGGSVGGLPGLWGGN